MAAKTKPTERAMTLLEELTSIFTGTAKKTDSPKTPRAPKTPRSPKRGRKAKSRSAASKKSAGKNVLPKRTKKTKRKTAKR